MQKGSKDLHHTDASTTQHQKNSRIKPKQAGGESLGPGGGRWDQRVGRAGQEQSGWVSHIHTLGVETGY